MQLTSLLAGTALTAMLALNWSSGAIALPAQHPAADIAAMHDYILTTGFLDKWKAIAQDSGAPKCSLMTLNLHGDSLDQNIADYDARPGNHAYLASHGLTAREMILGTWTLAAAGMREVQRARPGIVKGNANRLVSVENMAFYQSHKDEIHEFMRKLGMQQLQRDGVKLPDCAK